MKAFIVADDFSGVGPIWTNMLWPQFRAISECVDTEFLTVPQIENPSVFRMGRAWRSWQERRLNSADVCRSVLQKLDPNEPNVLIIWAANTRNVNWARNLYPIWSAFSHRILNICDTIQPDHLKLDQLQVFDAIFSPCADQARVFEEASGVPSAFLPAHSDVFNYHSTEEYRPIDMIVVGRRDPSLHDSVFRHYSQPDQKRLFLDFVTRTQMKSTCEEEFNLLMATYSKSKIAFCYEPSYVPRFRGNSPVLSRWVHAWSAGCTVLGTSPKGTGAAEQIDWKESIIEIPADPRGAIETIEGVLADQDGLLERRIRNVAESLERHDTRYRLKDMLLKLGLPVPEKLTREIKKVGERATEARALVR